MHYVDYTAGLNEIHKYIMWTIKQVLYEVYNYNIWTISRVYVRYINAFYGQYTQFLFCTTGGANGFQFNRMGY